MTLRTRVGVFPAILLLGLLLSCSPDADRTSLPLSPPESGAAAGATEPYRIEGRMPEGLPSISVSQVIGLLGGTLNLAGHSVHIPAGALTESAVVTLTLASNGYVEVEVTALKVSLLGRILNLGALGFKKPVSLTLTYAWASNVQDPSRLQIMRLKANGNHELLPSTVDTTRRTVTVQLDHFSRYCMVSN
jgi:hypothetical protein